MKNPLTRSRARPRERRRVSDMFGVRRAMAGSRLPLLSGAMMFLLALAIAGWSAAGLLIRHWTEDIGATVTLEVPQPGDPDASGSTPRREAVRSLLTASPAVTSVRILSDEEVAAVLGWAAGGEPEVSAPAIVVVRLSDPSVMGQLTDALTRAAPGIVVERDAAWTAPLAATAQAIRRGVAVLVAGVFLATFTVMVLGSSAAVVRRRDDIMILSQLGALDFQIAHAFARWAALLTAAGGAVGGLIALPVITLLTLLVTPSSGPWLSTFTAAELPSLLPPLLWLVPVATAVVGWLLGYVTTQIAVHAWLRKSQGGRTKR